MNQNATTLTSGPVRTPGRLIASTPAPRSEEGTGGAPRSARLLAAADERPA